MADFRHVDALGLEIRECRAQGADFRGASFMNDHQPHLVLQRLYHQSNLSYANFAKVVLEKCRLWENRWHGAGARRQLQRLRSVRRRILRFGWRRHCPPQCDLSNAELGELVCAPPICRALKWTVTRPLNCWSGWGSAIIG